MKTKRKYRTHRIYYAMRDGERLYWRVRVTDGKHTIFLNRTTKDVLKGKQGVTLTCADAYCAMRLKRLFPHPVVFADFSETVCHIVDKISNGRPIHAVRYAHDDVTIPEFDNNGGKEALIKSGRAEVQIRLSPPRKRYGNDDRGTRRPTGDHRGGGPKAKPTIPRGALRRAKAANLITI